MERRRKLKIFLLLFLSLFEGDRLDGIELLRIVAYIWKKIRKSLDLIPDISLIVCLTDNENDPVEKGGLNR